MRTPVRIDSLYQKRQSGATLQKTGSHFGISRERVRHQLTKHYGSTRIQGLITTAELVHLAGCTYGYIDKLIRGGIIEPAKVVGRGRMWWEPATVATIIIYHDSHRCPVCHQPLPGSRQVYCSQECYTEARRYKNKSEPEKRRHNERVAKWLAENPEHARSIQQRKQIKYQAKRVAQRSGIESA